MAARKSTKRQSLNEEQLAQGLKETGVTQNRLFFATKRVVLVDGRIKSKGANGRVLDSGSMSIIKSLTVEAERFYDARAFANRYFGTSECEIVPFKENQVLPLFPRWQIRWTGNACNGNNLAMQHRRVMEPRDTEDDGTRVPWLDVSQI